MIGKAKGNANQHPEDIPRATRTSKPVIYMIGPSFRTQGGISSVLLIYRQHFREALNLRFISSYSGDWRIKDFFYFGLAVVRVLAACLSDGESIFHIHTSTYGSYIRKSILARICKAFGKKVILHIHGADFDSFMKEIGPRWRSDVIHRLQEADRLVVLSESWRKFFAEYTPAEKIRVIYNPCAVCDPEYIPRSNSRTEVLFIGRMGKRKGTYDLIRAAAKIRDLDFVLRLYGDGEVEEIKRQVEAEKLTDKILVSGWVSHAGVGALYEQADLLVLPTYAEGLPMSILEAFGKGLPAISTPVGGIPELVEEGRSGYLIPPGDVDALAEKMSILIKDAALRQQMGRHALQTARDKFSPEKNLSQLKELYDL